MAQTEIINGENVRVNNTPKGVMYSKNFRSLKEECAALGTVDFRVNVEKHSLFLRGNAYYVGPSLQGKGAKELASLGREIQICESSVDKEKWVPCLFLPTSGESASFSF